MRKTMAKLCLMALLLEGIAACEGRAQDTLRTSTTLTAITVGMPGAGRKALPTLFTLGVMFNGFRPNNVNPEFALGTMPYAFASMVPVIGMRAGLAVPSVMTGQLILLPSTGVGAVLVPSTDVGGAILSTYAGIAAVFGTGQTSAFRAGVTWHFFPDTRTPIWLLEIGPVRPFRHRSG